MLFTVHSSYCVSAAASKTVTIKYKDGSIYTGSVLNGKKNGYGVCTWPSSKKPCNEASKGMGIIYMIKYEGQWKNDLMNGQGKSQYALPSVPEYKIIYTGNWVDGKRSGYGVLTADDWGIYKGSWQNDKFNGYGEILNSDASTYKGNWKNDLFDGYGNYNDPGENISQVGQWKNGSFIKAQPQTTPASTTK